LIAYAYDLDGNKYVSSVEHKQYPIYGVQFHPEKTSFIWYPTIPIPHNKKVRKVV